MESRSNGFAGIALIFIVAMMAAIGVLAYKIVIKWTETSPGSIRWVYDEQNLVWAVQGGNAPSCKDPFTFDVNPVDLSLINVIGAPGAYRGFNYKPHGGIRADGVEGGQLEVKAPIDANLVSVTRYYDMDLPDMQYLLTFHSDCGIAFRFDHLAELAPKYQEFADKTPPAKRNDTRTSPADQPAPIAVKAGEVVATRVGFASTKNYGFDFGVYDYRKPNVISHNPTWAKLHRKYSSLDYHGVCWLTMFRGDDAKKAMQLSEVILNTKRPTIVSDYCPNIKLKTLDVNHGMPTDG